jgi:hypothetical protein
MIPKTFVKNTPNSSARASSSKEKNVSSKSLARVTSAARTVF